MNLHLYLPPTSNHPPKMIKAIIYRLLKNYKTRTLTTRTTLKTPSYCTDAIKWGATRYPTSESVSCQPTKKLPKKVSTPDLPWQKYQTLLRAFPIQCIWHHREGRGKTPHRTLQGFPKRLNLLSPKICYSRPKIMRDLATQTRLHEHTEQSASYYIGERLKTQLLDFVGKLSYFSDQIWTCFQKKQPRW